MSLQKKTSNYSRRKAVWRYRKATLFSKQPHSPLPFESHLCHILSAHYQEFTVGRGMGRQEKATMSEDLHTHPKRPRMTDTCFNTQCWAEISEAGSTPPIKLTAVANASDSVCSETNSYHSPLHTQHPAKRMVFLLIQLSHSEIAVLFDGASFFSGKLVDQDSRHSFLCHRLRVLAGATGSTLMTAFLSLKL